MNEIDVIKSKLSDYHCEDSYVFDAIKSIESKLVLLEKLQDTLYTSELFLVYKHTSPDGKVYIGITKNAPNTRWNEGSGYETQRKFYKAIQKFGWINFKHEIIAAGLNEEEAKILESDLILKYKSNEEEYGYNTQVLNKNSSNINKDKNISTINNKSKADIVRIANELITEFSIKTIDGTIYYLKDGKYHSDKELPFLQKLLLLTYDLRANKHKAIFDSIKILSFCNVNTISKNNALLDPSGLEIFLTSYFTNINIDDSVDFVVLESDLYNEYSIWANKFNLDLITYEEFIKICLAWMNKHCENLLYFTKDSGNGWKLCKNTSHDKYFSILSSTEVNSIIEYLNTTEEQMVCIPMICEVVLGISQKIPRSMSNEIVKVITTKAPNWKKDTVRYTKTYGNQRCYVKINNK